MGEVPRDVRAEAVNRRISSQTKTCKQLSLRGTLTHSSSEAPQTPSLAFRTLLPSIQRTGFWVQRESPVSSVATVIHKNAVRDLTLLIDLDFMGTSSNWSFGRRVLAMTYEQLIGRPLPPEDLLYDGNVYPFSWDGTKSAVSQYPFDASSLPTRDFALHIINTVKFHCGQLFYLFVEENFMAQFVLFHQDPAETSRVSPLWYVHYLLILAFGKSLVAQSGKGTKPPPGIDLFVRAMQLMPDFTFLEADPIEKIQVMCCAALYLQCLEHRSAAHRIVSR